jgi:hypothetical protein
MPADSRGVALWRAPSSEENPTLRLHRAVTRQFRRNPEESRRHPRRETSAAI